MSDMGCQKSSCCPPGSWPKLATTYKPIGNNFKLQNGAEVYHIGQGKRVLIMLTDIFGVQSGFTKGLADTYAQLGYNVYLPQILSSIFSGDVTDFGQITAYLKSLKNQIANQTFNQLVAVIEKQGYKQYFLVGFCLGVWKAFDLSKDGHKGIVAFAGFHPSVMAQNLLGGNDVQLSKKLQHPGFLYTASNDQANLKVGGQIFTIMQGKFGDKCGTLDFPDMTHGWVNRGIQQELVVRDRNKAIQHSHAYFSKFEI